MDSAIISLNSGYCFISVSSSPSFVMCFIYFTIRTLLLYEAFPKLCVIYILKALSVPLTAFHWDNLYFGCILLVNSKICEDYHVYYLGP